VRVHHLILWLALLVAPGVALVHLARFVDTRLVFGGLVALNLLTYAVYATDKRRAQQGEWRVAELVLHGLEFLGGWPTAFIAQRRLFHKTSKRRYQVVFWSIVLIHQYVAIDYVTQWRVTRSIRDGLGFVS
jgi:uncharacterized membrane protein YsdA (DUF1294 family)